MQFFWEKSNKSSKARSRFNLLLLEYGEFYFEDYSSALYSFPVGEGNQISSHNLLQIDSIKWLGRLKVCSRCLIFEPSDIKKPLLKFPFRYILSDVSEFPINSNTIKVSSIDTSGFLTFTCTSYFEMKSGNKIGPYRQVEPSPTSLTVGSSPSNAASILSSTEIKYDPITKRYMVLISLIHSSISVVLEKINHLRRVFDGGERINKGDILLKPLVEEASYTLFDSSRLVNFHERLLLPKPVIANKIKPLVMFPGCLMVTESRVYFQSAQLNNVGEHLDNTIFDLSKITRVYKRRYLLQQIGIELFLNDQSSTLLVFETRIKRDEIYTLIARQRQGYPQNPPLESITKKWQRREISNYEYLMYLNSEADRSVNDLTQYPVFPHIISDYISKTLDLTSPNTFRDLSKPIGALTSHRLESFKERFYNMSPADEAYGVPPPFLYGTHYSTPGYVLFYLVRVAPEHMLCLQNGRFDVTDRMFSSVKDMWQSCLMNPADLKELIPEFFSGHGDFLINSEGLNMGHKHTGERLEDVELPPWAKTPQDFIRKNIKALESDYVSANLHHWIDLIFGYKQTGEEAIKADNLFYYLTYEGSVDVEKLTDSVKRKAIEVQIQEFGQTPKQLFDGPHPARAQMNAHVPVKNDIQLYTSAYPTFDGIVKDSDPALAAAKSGKSLPAGTPRKDSSAATPSPNPSPNKLSMTLQEDTPNSVADAKVVVLDADFKAEVEQELRNSGTAYKGALVEEHLSTTPMKDASGNQRVTTKSILGAAAATRTGAGAWALWNSIATTTTNIFRPPNGSQPDLSPAQTDSTYITSAAGVDALSPTQSANTKIGNSNNEALKVATTNKGSESIQSSQQISPIKNEAAPSYLTSPLFADTFTTVDPSKVSLIPGEAIRLHSSAITSISAQHDKSHTTTSSKTTTGEAVKSLSFLLAASAKDSSVKVLSLHLDPAIFASSSSVGSESILEACAIRGNVKRTFLTGAEPPLSSCVLTQDATTVFAGCWDNSIYSYSVASASELGRREAHTDSVSALSTDIM